jgi:tetratricopeptide (TPR) repeat protein
LDLARSSALKKTLAFLLPVIALLPLAGRAAQLDQIARAKSLYHLGQWPLLVKIFPDSPNLPAEVDYYRGMAFAKLGRLPEARQAFVEGQRKDPRNEQFPLELAGIAFKQKNYHEAKKRLRQALRLNPKDVYAREFLATISFLEHNLDAALENWNQIGKPRIRDLTVDPQIKVDPGLLSRAFTISPASSLQLKDLRTTRARIDQLGIFSRYRFTLLPSGAGNDSNAYDLHFDAVERNAWDASKWQGLLSLFRGLPYETIDPEYFNIHRSAINLTSLFRWDDQKRRAEVILSAPLRGDPQWRYRIYADARNENWDMARTFHGVGPPLTDLNLRKAEVGGEIQSVVSGRWRWWMGAELARRTFRNFTASSQAALPEFENSTSLEYLAETDYLLLDRPESRFTLDSSIAAQLGRTFGRSPGKYQKIESAVRSVWFPQAQSDDYRMSEDIHLGDAGGDVPFDELFILGLERDNDLPLRAHIGTFDGRKGNAPLGRRYFLSNWEVDKNLYSNGWVSLKLAPLLDTGRITDSTGLFGEPAWLWDTGGEMKVRVFGGLSIVLTYGKDLRTGRNTFYTSVEQ